MVSKEISCVLSFQLCSHSLAKRSIPLDSAQKIHVDDQEDVVSQKIKRRRIIVDSDSDEENSRPHTESGARPDTEANATPKAAIKKPLSDVPITSNKKAKLSDDKLSSFEEKLKFLSSEETATDIDTTDFGESHALVDEPTVWKHSTLDFLQPDKIKDINGHRLGHPQYDPTTLFVPPKHLETLSPVSIISIEGNFSVIICSSYRVCVSGGY